MFYVKLQVIFATLDGSIANVMTTRDEQNTYFQIQPGMSKIHIFKFN